jgi:hypothetical protein
MVAEDSLVRSSIQLNRELDDAYRVPCWRIPVDQGKVPQEHAYPSRMATQEHVRRNCDPRLGLEVDDGTVESFAFATHQSRLEGSENLLGGPAAFELRTERERLAVQLQLDSKAVVEVKLVEGLIHCRLLFGNRAIQLRLRLRLRVCP